MRNIKAGGQGMAGGQRKAEKKAGRVRPASW